MGVEDILSSTYGERKTPPHRGKQSGYRRQQLFLLLKGRQERTHDSCLKNISFYTNTFTLRQATPYCSCWERKGHQPLPHSSGRYYALLGRRRGHPSRRGRDEEQAKTRGFWRYVVFYLSRLQNQKGASLRNTYDEQSRGQIHRTPPWRSTSAGRWREKPRWSHRSKRSTSFQGGR